MGLNNVASAERIHISFFGCRNAGKSSIVNAITGQELSLVSHIKGTTTDPVKKTMELLPLGPVVITDTPGIDDEGTLGSMRVHRTRQVLNYTDIAILVIDAVRGLSSSDHELITIFKEKDIPFLVAYNKVDLLADACVEIQDTNHVIPDENTILVSAATGHNIHELKENIALLVKKQENNKRIVADLLCKGDTVILVTPIDASAPKGRLILPQQQTIRDILEAGAISVVCQDTELSSALDSLRTEPRLVITDSQAFGKVSQNMPSHIPLTSFSILFARYKGNLPTVVEGAAKLNQLKDGDTVLISEGCTHHRQCGDIGTVKLPAWIKNYTKKDIQFDFTSGMDFPEDLSKYALIIHCGGCMLNEREMQYRLRHATDCGVSITNYGIAIALIHGILKRSLEPFPAVLKLLE